MANYYKDEFELEKIPFTDQEFGIELSLFSFFRAYSSDHHFAR